jgi:hypothetical protein
VSGWVWVVAAFSEFIDLAAVLVWPLVVVFALLVAITDRGRRLLRPILRRIRKVTGPGGFALELSVEAAAATKADVEGAIRDFSVALRDEFERLAYAEDVRNRLAATVQDALSGHELPAGHDYRATVHVRDALYVDALYQLVDYWPGGTGAGRRYSTRFGMLGRAWRLGTSEYEDDIPTTAEDLIKGWGMTQEQAERAGRDRRSFVCGILQHGGSLVGVLYLDAKRERAFPTDIVDRLDNSQLSSELASAVARVHERIASRGPGIELLSE